MRVRKCQYCKGLVDEASWCDCAEAERDMRAFDDMVRASRSAIKPATPEPLGVWPVKTLTIEDARERWPATPEPPEWRGPVWIDDGTHDVTPDWWQKVADFTAKRKAKRTDAEAQAEAAGFMTKPLATEIAEAQERACARAMSAPLPHDPPISARLMPWRGKE